MIEFKEIKKIVEALIFASDTPISENRIKNVIEELTPAEINNLVEELNAEYDQTEHAFRIARLAGGFQFVTRPELANYIKQYYKGKAKSRLSRAALEALAIIAFKQPISRPEIDMIRGVNSDGVVKNLLERNLIFISGRSETIGRALLYSTTPEFLRYLGINEISDLPKPKEIEELLGSPQEELPFSGEEVDEKIVEKISALDEPEVIDDAAE
ncbi:SMC-Scp complex subunit ScpB [candidate division KSB1 bacterium]|nr:SMC-Scp complex subunit ScpB [candidate division KSB1 bacterium]